MRFMMLVKADKNSESGAMPSTELVAEMGKFNEEMMRAGVMLAGEGAPPELEGRPRAAAEGRATTALTATPSGDTLPIRERSWTGESCGA